MHRLAAFLMIVEDRLLGASSVPGLSLMCVASAGKEGVRAIQ
jgi:hypothetical protein